MFTRSYRARTHQELRPFDLDLYLSNSERAPPPTCALSKLSGSHPCDTQSELNSPLTSLQSHKGLLSPSMSRGSSSGTNRSSPISETPIKLLDRAESDYDDRSLITNGSPREGRAIQDYCVNKFAIEDRLKANGSNFVTWKRLQLLVMRNNEWDDYLLRRIEHPLAPRHHALWRKIYKLSESIRGKERNFVKLCCLISSVSSLCKNDCSHSILH